MQTIKPEVKPEARNPKSEGNPKPEWRIARSWRVPFSDFGLRPSLGFRASTFEFWALRLGIFALLLLRPQASRASAPAAANSFDSANKLYELAKYPEAAAAYETLLQSGRVSSALLFNLGNADFKAGRVGQAIVCYRRAEQLTPRDPDLRANLRFARNQVQGATLPPTRLASWLGRLTLNEWTSLTVVALWIWLLMLASAQWRPVLKPALRTGTILLGVAALLLTAGSAAAFYDARAIRTAIVISRDLPIRLGPFDESQTAYTAHDGAELRVTDHKDDWVQVTAGPRLIGWIKRSQITVLE